VGAKHRMTVARQRNQSRMWAAAPLSLLCAASFAAVTFGGTDQQQPATSDHVTAATPPAAAAQPVSQEGVLIAVTPTSITARSASGYTQTYLITPDTTVISRGGSQPATGSSHFTVNDTVSIVGTVQGGKTIATSLANRTLGHGDGPPMDSD
jgi:hypothetical protein